MKSLPFSSALQAHIDAYSAAHQAPVNKVLHYLGIPLLLIAALGLLSKVSIVDSEPSPWRPNLAWGALLVAGAWYL